MKYLLALSAVFLITQPSYAWKFRNNSVSSNTVMLNFNENAGAITLDSSDYHRTCSFNNSPVWVVKQGIRMIKFDNTDAYIQCNSEADMPYGNRPRTIMFGVHMDTPAVKDGSGDKWLWKLGPDDAHTFYAMSMRNDRGGAISIWPSNFSQINFDSLKISTATPTVIVIADSGGTNGIIDAYVITKSSVMTESTINVTNNTLPGTMLIGSWSVANSDSRASYFFFLVTSRKMPVEEILGRARQALSGGRVE